MELDRSWEAIIADDEARRRWLDEPISGSDHRPHDHDSSDQDASHRDGDDGGPVEEPRWQPVQVPGHWRDDGAFADSDGPLLYRTRFEHPGPAGDERWWLVFDGVFYQGDVWLDGTYVGDTEGYFFPHGFEVTEALADRSDHVLGVEVTCAPQTDRRAKRNITGVFQHWDVVDQDLNPGGIWRPVRLERTGPVRIRHLRVICTEADEERATVAFRAVLDAAEAREVTLRSSVGDTDLTEHRRLAAGENQVEWQITIEDPELWWPHSLGTPVLHDVVVEVVPHLEGREIDRTTTTHDEADGPTEGENEAPIRLGPVSHRLTRRVGLREVRLRGWVLHVNGERLFTKGVNLAPTRMHLGAAEPDELRRDVRLAKDAGLDLVRVLGHISRPELYDAADEAGMLVWQDFPLQWGYARTIRKQAIRQAREAVDLLGHHPSIVLWCGHNAPEAVGDGPSAAIVGAEGGRSRLRYLAGQELPSWNRTVLDRSVKRALDRADGSRPVIPHSGVLPHPPMLDGTDTHLHLGWYRGEATDLIDLARTVPRMVRFVSQFGAGSVPETAEFMEPHRWPELDWERLERHHGMQREIFDLRVPPAHHETFESWRDATQHHQAELLVRQIEILRRLKYRPTGGFAMLMLADGQPAVSWSLLDHDRVPKLAYEAVRHVCRPLIVAADPLPPTLAAGAPLAIDVHVVNDLRTPIEELEVRAVLRWSDGAHRWRFGGSVEADACARVGTLQIEVPETPGELELELELVGAEQRSSYRRLDRSRIVAI